MQKLDYFAIYNIDIGCERIKQILVCWFNIWLHPEKAEGWKDLFFVFLNQPQRSGVGKDSEAR